MNYNCFHYVCEFLRFSLVFNGCWRLFQRMQQQHQSLMVNNLINKVCCNVMNLCSFFVVLSLLLEPSWNGGSDRLD